MKKTIHFALGAALVCLTAASSFAQFGGGPAPMPGPGSMSGSGVEPLPGAGGMPGVVPNGGGQQQVVMPFNPNSMPGTYANGSYPSTSGGGMPMLDMRQVVMQGISTLQPMQRDQLAQGMAGQNLAQLQQGMASSSSPINQIRNSIRDQIMTNRVREIAPMGQSTFRPMIQPGAVQSMISQIQPWNFPIRFQSAMMPNMIPIVSQPIKQQQMAYMQQGIMNQNFPNVRLPAPAFGPSSGGGYYPPNTGGGYPSPPGGMSMYGNGYGYGMPPGGMGMMGGMGYGGGYYGMPMMPPGGGMGGYGYSPYGY